MELALALTAVGKGVVLFALTGVAAPLIGLGLRHFVGSGWDAIGSGPFSIVHESARRRGGGRGPAVDPAIQAAEVRQMLEAKAARQERRGEDPLDVESEAERLLAEADSPGERRLDIDAELRAEVRQLVIARNERRMRAGRTPLDVEAEIERQLDDFVGSS
ncbi:MAG TPA: hypothetical protein VHA54_01365 [Solirubrobacterales bacterium]|nr:hypothetical protein [Solirubrobacterales bacterium]